MIETIYIMKCDRRGCDSKVDVSTEIEVDEDGWPNQSSAMKQHGYQWVNVNGKEIVLCPVCASALYVSDPITEQPVCMHESAKDDDCVCPECGQLLVSNDVYSNDNDDMIIFYALK